MLKGRKSAAPAAAVTAIRSDRASAGPHSHRLHPEAPPRREGRRRRAATRTGGRGAGTGKEPPSKGGSSNQTNQTNQTNHRRFNSMRSARICGDCELQSMLLVAVLVTGGHARTIVTRHGPKRHRIAAGARTDCLIRSCVMGDGVAVLRSMRGVGRYTTVARPCFVIRMRIRIHILVD